MKEPDEIKIPITDFTHLEYDPLRRIVWVTGGRDMVLFDIDDDVDRLIVALQKAK